MNPYLIAIAGGSGSGKSWLAGHLAARLPAMILSLDSYYRDLAHLDLASRARQNFDAPEALDWELLSSHVQALTQGRDVDIPVYDFAIHARKTETARIHPGAYMIVEGLFALYDERVRNLCLTKVFMSVDDATCLARRLERDVRERGRTPESVITQYNQTVRPMYERYILPTRQYADLVLSGKDPAEKLAAAVIEHINRQVSGVRCRSLTQPSQLGA